MICSGEVYETRHLAKSHACKNEGRQHGNATTAQSGVSGEPSLDNSAPAELAPAPTIAVSGVAPATPLPPTPVPPTPAPSSDQGGGEPPSDDNPGRAAPTPEATPFVEIRVIAVSDLAGGDDACPGCDGLGPEDYEAANVAPLGTVSVIVEAIGPDGVVVTEQHVTLEGVDASSAAADVRMGAAARYRVTLAEAPGFALCPAQTPQREVTAESLDGPPIVQFVLWQGCPVDFG